MTGSTSTEQNWERFRQSAALRYEDGRRLLVPILGAGSRLWLTQGRPEDALGSWKALLKELARATEVDLSNAAQGSLTSAFEHVIHVVHARSPDTQRVSRTERDLIDKHVREPMRAATRVARERDDVRSRAQLFNAGRYADRIDLCFDGVLSGDGVTSHSGSASFDNPRTACVVDGACRSWHPHGYADAPDREAYLVLGVQRYGRAVHGAVHAFERHMKNGPRRHAGGSEASPGATIESLNAHRGVPGAAILPAHWLEVALHAPLVLLGVGLGPEEWDLAWFLQARARVHARMPDIAQPWTFRLTCREDDLVRERARATMPGIELLDLYVDGDWNAAWERYFRELDAHTPVILSPPSSPAAPSLVDPAKEAP